MASSQEHPAVTNFRDYLRINTAQPEPDYVSCVKFLVEKGREAGGEVAVVDSSPGKPVVVISFIGTQPCLPTLLLNSHTDVVPVFPKHWKHDPFEAYKDENGDIYGRGSQDMKCVGIQYLEAVKKLRKQNKTFLRTINLTFMPEEEVGGILGMRKFVNSPEFKKLNVGFALDEGYANPTESFYVFYGERCCRRFFVRCSGQPGHASQFLQNTAVEKLQKVINSFLGYRKEQENKLKSNPELQLGDVTTVNLTLLKGGVQFNVVPDEVSVGFDVRIAQTEVVQEMERKFKRWCEEAGDDVTIEYLSRDSPAPLTCVEDGQSPWWDAFSKACKREKISLDKTIFPAGTDSRYVRAHGIPALGFSPMNNTPILLHDHNEYLNEKVFLRGIDIYCSIIEALANVHPPSGTTECA